MYGTIDATGEAAPSPAPTPLDAVFEIRNGSWRSGVLDTAQLEKRFAGGTELSAAYT